MGYGVEGVCSGDRWGRDDGQYGTNADGVSQVEIECIAHLN
jgi:hypothetical protein